jgi:CPA1 family monovalent cation:H+ antiporter
MLGMIAAQRQALLDVRDEGLFSAEALNAALAVLDADQISLELKGGPA